MLLFRQLFDSESFTYTYLLADEVRKHAVIIDPVLSKTPFYHRLICELELNLLYAIDTHVHADHITALGNLQKIFMCKTIHGIESKAKGISHYVRDGEYLHFGKFKLKAIHTPGHTPDSYCYLLCLDENDYLFSGDTLLIRRTGRTDFQEGNSKQQYESLKNKILVLDEQTRVYPGHDYLGNTMSTLAEEKLYNPRLQANNAEEYCTMMRNLKLEKPRNIETTVPANLVVGNI